MLRGNVTVIFAEGFTSPNRTSAIALPASTPGNQAFSMADTCWSAHVSSNGRPVKTTKTIGLPVATSASRSCNCGSGRFGVARDAPSPFIFMFSPSAAIITSLLDATTRASRSSSPLLRHVDSLAFPALAKPIKEPARIFSNSGSFTRWLPVAYSTQPWVPTAVFNPSIRDTGNTFSELPLQHPSMSFALLPNGPITAMR